MKVLLTSFFFLACNFIQAQNDWDIQFSLNTYDCEANTACYTLELQSASAASWALGDQNYRLFFDGDLMTVTSVTSLLPGTLYGAANIDQNVKLSGQGQEAASPLDDIDDNLGFLDFNIVQTDKSNPASAVSIVTTGFTAVADICVDVAPAVFDDFSGNDCLAFYHSRPTTAGGITTQYTVLTENDASNNTVSTEGVDYNDLTSADNNEACLGQLCTSEWDIKLTLGNVDCNANEACYIVELQSASAASWALGDQNYRFFFDGDLMTVTSVTSLLSGTLYGAANIDQNVKLSGQGQEAASPLDDIDDNLGFLDFSIVQTDKSNPVAAQQLLTTEYIQTAEICVAFNPTVLTDPTGTECISFYHSRPATAGQITTQYTVISENISPNNTAPTTAVTYDDVVDDCLEVVCASTTVAENDINQTPINTPVDGDVSTNDYDPEGDNQTVTSALADTDGDGVVDDNLPIGVSTTIYGTDDNNTVVEAGTITLNSDGTYSYTPAVDFTGDVPFAYTVTDDNANPTTDDATVTIEVIGSSIPGVNEPPVANDDTKTTEQDVNVGGNVLDNDSDPDGDVITVTSALADTDGDGLVDEPLTLGSPTPIYGEDESGATVLAGSLTLNPDGTFTFDPEPSYLGEVPVDYTISDPAGLTDEARLTITIEADQGNATYANDDANVGPQDEVQTGNILTNDNDPEGDNQAVTGATDSGNTALVVDGVTANVLPSGGSLVIDTDGSYTYTPAPGFVGTEIVTYDIVDDGSPVATDVATLYLTTLPLNTTLAENDINQTPINTPVDGDVSTNDSDDQGDNQTVTSALADTDGDGVVDDNLPIGVSTTIYGTDDNNTVVEAGTITLNSDGTYSYTPAVDFTGDVPFAYTVTDDNANPTTDDATVTIEVIGSSIPGVNEPPVANDDTKTTEQDVNVGGNVLDNDSDPDGDVITVTSALADTDGDGLVDEPLTLGSPTPIYGEDETGATVLAGSLTLNPDGTFTFDPEPSYLGEVPVDYTISDPAGLTDEARLTITIESDQGNATYANDDANVGPQDEVQTGNILTNDNDPEGDNQAVTGATDSGNTALVVDGVTANVLPSGGSLVIDTDGSYTYTPAPGFVGTEIVTYDIVDDGSPVATDVATLYLTTLPLNTTVAENDINQTPINTPVDGDVSTNDSDDQGDNQTVTSALADTDGDGVVDDNLPIGVSTTIYGTDDNNTVVEAGTITLNSDGTYSYTPAVDFTGDVPFAYTVTDDNANPTTDDATVTIEVIGSSIPGVNEPPVANDDTKTTEQDVNVGGNVLDNDSDPDGDVITVTSALADTDGDGLVDEPLTLGSPTPIYGEDETGATVLAGTLTLNPDGTFTFDPEPSYLGEVPVDYTISDPDGLTDEARLTITIESDQGNATYANDDANVGPQDEVQTGNILTNDNDPEGDNQAVTGATDSGNTALVVDGVTANVLPSGGSLVIDMDGSYTYTPAPGFVGTEIVTYDIVDDGSPVATDVATLYLTTLPLNTTVAENDINQTPINTPVDGDVSTNDSDDQGDNQTVTSALADTDGDGVADDNLPIGVSTTIYGTDDDGNVVVAGDLILNSDGTYSYTPAVDFTGDVPFAYTVTDDNANPTTDDATVTIEVIGSSIPGVNEPPVANDDTKTTEQDVNVGGNVLDNDSDPDGDVITVTSALADTDGDGLVDEPLTLGSPTPIYGEDESGATVLAGSLTLNPDGTFTFDPEPTYLGEVPVDYTISDPAGLTDEARLTITIESDQGNATYANDDANVGPQDEVQTGNILTNDDDPEGDNQAVTGATDSGNTALVVDGVTANVLPSGGSLVIDTDGSYTYTPAPGFVGTEIVTYDIVDDGSPVATDVATLYLTTLPLNTTLAENDINQTPINTPVDGDVSTNDSDDQGDNQTVTSALADTDGDGVVDDNLPIGVSTTIYGTDDNNTVVEAGTITLNSDGTYSYTPAVDFTGDVPFAYTVTDDNANPTTDDATVTIEVIGSSIPGVNEPPVANDDTKTTEQDVNVGGNVLDNDSDPDGDVITVTSALADTDGDGLVDEPLTLGSPTPIYGEDETGATVLAGSLTLNPDGTFTFDPEPSYLGEVPVDYTISDPAGLTDEARLTITIESDQGNATYANDDANVGPQDEVQTGNILTNDNDPEGDNQAVTGATDSGNTALVVDGVTANVLPSGGSLVIDTDGSYTYTPAPGFVGTEIVTYDIVDDGSPVATDVATLYLTTLPLNCVTIEAYVYLEGSLITPQTGAYQTPMRTTLNTSKLLPGQYSENVFSGNIYTPTLGATGQAYNIDPWNYNGGEGSLYDSGSSSANADAGYPSTVTDWVLVSLRSDPSNGSEVLCQRAGLLHSDGRIEFLSNADCCNLDQDQDYYIVIEHRNHLIVMSHEAVPIVNGKIIYDFRDKQSYINDPFGAGIVIGQKEVLPGVFAMFAGNGDQTSGVNDDTDINASDYGVWLNNGPQNRTYNLIDYNMDGEVSALDFELWQTNSPRFTSVPRQ